MSIAAVAGHIHVSHARLGWTSRSRRTASDGARALNSPKRMDVLRYGYVKTLDQQLLSACTARTAASASAARSIAASACGRIA